MHLGGSGHQATRLLRQKSDIVGLSRKEAQKPLARRGDGPEKDYRRSRSMGPVHLRQNSPSEPREERRSRSRGRTRPSPEDSARSRSRGRSADHHRSFLTRGAGDGSSRRSRSRGRTSPSRPSGIDRSGSRSREGERRRRGGPSPDRRRDFGPPSPEEAQATLEKLLPRFVET